MMVKMRLFRMGDKKNPIYRVVVVDSRKAATGEYIDCVGHYRPTCDPIELTIDNEKAKEWIAKGVQPTETVKNLLVKAGAIEKSAKLSPSKTKTKKSK
ncbi:MAG: 30S ribosomal protein S16 [Clostridiales bacterium]|nr:30S ribosomal protein S16 [Clostridiales bacterium]